MGTGVTAPLSSPLYRWTDMVGRAAEAYDDGNELGALVQFILAAEQVSPLPPTSMFH